MALQDVSNDSSMIGWLQQSGHGHLLSENRQYSTISAPPIISAGHISANPSYNAYHRSSPVPPSYVSQSQSANLVSSPTQFFASHSNAQLDMDIEKMRRDPNTQVVHRPTQGDVVYRQRVFMKYLQPPTPPPAGAIIIREKQSLPLPPDPPLVIRRAPPPPPTPPPVVIREPPPMLPPSEGTTIIDKIIPPPPKLPRQVIIEQHPTLPPKPRDVIIEKWLPIQPRQRPILYQRLAAPLGQQVPPRPIIVQYGPPNIHIQRQLIAAPGPEPGYQSLTTHAGLDQVVSQFGVNQQIHTALPPSSLISYSPYSALQQSVSTINNPQSNTIVIRSEQPNVIASSSYGTPLSCVCASNQPVGLGAYGSGVTVLPTAAYLGGPSTVYNIPETVPIGSILQQLGINPQALQHLTGTTHPSIDPTSAVSHVWNAASHANTPHSTDPSSSVSHVWNAAAHASDPSHLHPSHVGPYPAVSHVWNAAAHATDPSHLHPSHVGLNQAVPHVWNAAAHATDPSHLHPSHVGPYPAVPHVWNAAAHATDPSHLYPSHPGPAWNYPQSNFQSQQGFSSRADSPVQSSWSRPSYPNSPPPGAPSAISRIFGGR